MFAILLPCIPCLTKHTKQEMSSNDIKKRKFESQSSLGTCSEPLKADDVQGLAGIRTRMQEMGHFLNDSSTDPATSTRPEILVNTKSMGITAELISVVPREPRNCGEKSGTEFPRLDCRPTPSQMPDRNFVPCKALAESSICAEWDQMKKDLGCKAVSHCCRVLSFLRAECSPCFVFFFFTIVMT